MAPETGALETRSMTRTEITPVRPAPGPADLEAPR